MLPILTTVEDVRKLVNYLKTKVTGASTAEMKATLGSNIADPRKISAYTSWKIAERNDESALKLSERGWRLARRTTSERDIFREVIDGIVPYRSALEMAFHQGILEPTNVDVADHWHRHHTDEIGTANENTLKDAAVCFFHLCQGAELGKLIIGRHGQPTRLQVAGENLKEFIEAGPTSLPTSATPVVLDEKQASNQPLVTGIRVAESAATAASLPNPEKSTPQTLKIFITHGKNMTLVDQVQTMLGLANFESEVAEESEATAIPVPEKIFSAMRRCQAGIIIVSAEDGHEKSKGRYAVNENVLIEIGAAFVLYDRRVVLVWDKRLEVPSNLQGLYRCEFEGDEFTWSAGMKLMKAIREFKN